MLIEWRGEIPAYSFSNIYLSVNPSKLGKINDSWYFFRPHVGENFESRCQKLQRQSPASWGKINGLLMVKLKNLKKGIDFCTGEC